MTVAFAPSKPKLEKPEIEEIPKTNILIRLECLHDNLILNN
jgi:hypothetical protein